MAKKRKQEAKVSVGIRFSRAMVEDVERYALSVATACGVDVQFSEAVRLLVMAGLAKHGIGNSNDRGEWR